MGVLLPICTSVLGFWYSAARMLFAMGRQNFLPAVFAKCNRYGQPILPNLLILAISIGFLAMQEVEFIINSEKLEQLKQAHRPAGRHRHELCEHDGEPGHCA